MLRSSGKSADAEALFAGQLASAIARARQVQELSETQLGALFSAEEDRVDTAQTIAEILLPLLTAAGGIAALQRNFSSQPFSESDAAINGDSAFGSSSEPGRAPANNNSPMLPGIADFIDEMLTQDRAPPDPRNGRRPA
ncbi:MAG: hypothetical protein ABIO94_04240 [Opitutaceae bacterium]